MKAYEARISEWSSDVCSTDLAREHRLTGVRLRDVVDQLHHVDGLADAGAAEQADLAALGERAQQIDDLDAGFQQLGRPDRKSVVSGKSVSVRVDLGGRRIINKKNRKNTAREHIYKTTNHSKQKSN